MEAQPAPSAAAAMSDVEFSTNEMFKAIEARAAAQVEGTPLQKCLGFAINPGNYWRLKWDLSMFIIVLYSSVA